jgi:hypothetical protein
MKVVRVSKSIATWDVTHIARVAALICPSGTKVNPTVKKSLGAEVRE